MGERLARPLPIPNLRQVLAVLRDVLFVLDELVANGLLGVGGMGTERGHAINHVGDEVKAIQVVDEPLLMVRTDCMDSAFNSSATE